MRVIYLIFLLLFSSQTLSAIYRWVEADGTVVFSDEERPGAEVIQLPPSATYSPPDVQEITQTESDKDTVAAPDYQIAITAPAANESIWVNNGDVKVTLSIEPELDTASGDAVQVYLDGQTIGEPQATTSYQFTNLSRGSHEVTAKIISADDKELASDQIVFHLHRASKLNNP